MTSEMLLTAVLSVLVGSSLLYNASANQKMGRLVAICENYNYRLSMLERAVFGNSAPNTAKK